MRKKREGEMVTAVMGVIESEEMGWRQLPYWLCVRGFIFGILQRKREKGYFGKKIKYCCNV